MNFIKVWKDRLDWTAECHSCSMTIGYCSDWPYALEMAYGHLCMWHGQPVLELAPGSVFEVCS